MVKLISAVLFVLILCSVNFAQPKLFGYKISGNGDIISDVFLIQDGFILDSAIYLSQTYKFEYYGDGKLKRDINFIKFSIRDTITGRLKLVPGYRDYFYNERGDIDSVGTGILIDSLPAAGSRGYKINYSFDTEGNLISKTYLYNSGIIVREENSYDSSGKLILNKVILDETDTTYNIREYDSINRLTLAKSFRAVSQYIEQFKYQYDSSGNVNCTFQSNYQSDFNYYLEFDESGKLSYEIMYLSYNPADSSWMDTVEIIFKYDEYDRVLKMGESAWFRYNADGNLDTLINLHMVISGYMANKGRLLDSYGNVITFPNLDAMYFYYSNFVTGINQNKLDVLNFSYQNYPNPFNPTTTITYSLPKSSLVTLKIYDILGKEVATLVNEEKQSGTYHAVWNAREAASGVYFYKLTAGEYSKVNKMILIK